MAKFLNVNGAGVAIQAYEPVSYFADEPTPGNSSISSTFDGAIYYFVNEENKAKFDATPAEYAPQYGVFCAVAVSEGKTFPVDPETYKVNDGKLYLSGLTQLDDFWGRSAPPKIVQPLGFSWSVRQSCLFYNGKLGNTKPQWDADEVSRRASADDHWAKEDLVEAHP